MKATKFDDLLKFNQHDLMFYDNNFLILSLQEFEMMVKKGNHNFVGLRYYLKKR